MAETLRELAAALSLDSSNFLCNSFGLGALWESSFREMPVPCKKMLFILAGISILKTEIVRITTGRMQNGTNRNDDLIDHDEKSNSGSVGSALCSRNYIPDVPNTGTDLGYHNAGATVAQ